MKLLVFGLQRLEMFKYIHIFLSIYFLVFFCYFCELTGVRMEERWVSVKLCEASVRVDCSDKTVTFSLSLWQTDGDKERLSSIYINYED